MRNATSYRLTEEVLTLIEKLAKKLGLSRASVIEMSVRKLAELEKIEHDN